MLSLTACEIVATIMSEREAGRNGREQNGNVHIHIPPVSLPGFKRNAFAVAKLVITAQQ